MLPRLMEGPTAACIFCRILAGEIPSSRVFEDDHVVAFMDIAAVTEGHFLVIPREHVETLYALDPVLAGHLMAVTTRLAKAAKAALECDGMNLYQANEDAGGQEVPHLHMHVIPRYKGDSFGVKYHPTKPPREKLEADAARIRAAL
jgi:histidine triad (HIT) family protein